MRINDWLALEEKYKFKFPDDFFPLYRELERTGVISDWKSDGLGEYGDNLDLLSPETLEAWWHHPSEPDLLPVIGTPTMGAICLRLPFEPDEPGMWVERDQETNYRASLGRKFGGVIRVLAAYIDAWSFDYCKNGEMEKADAMFRRSRRILTDVRGLMDEKERGQLINLPFWPLFHGDSPVVSNTEVIIPSFQPLFPGLICAGDNALKWAKLHYECVLKEDPSFGAGHWGLGLAYSLSEKVTDACRELSLMMEGDLRTASPRINIDYAAAYGSPLSADYLFSAQYLRRHEAEYRLASRNHVLRSIILGEKFETQAAWLDGLKKAMQSGWYKESRPIAQSLLASYFSDQWFDHFEESAFDMCVNSLATIYAAAGLECRVNGAGK